MSRYWILDGKEPVPTDDVLEWARFFETGRPVWRTRHSGYWVSTAFIGLGDPLNDPRLFETMVFQSRSRDGVYQSRSSSWDDAVYQHRVAIDWVNRKTRPCRKELP